MSDESDDEGLGCIGFMFDAQRSKTVQHFTFGDISVAVRAIGDDPGHVQSGQYLWPAAESLARYLSSEREMLCKYSVVIELGAGCGLAGITSAKLLSDKGCNVFLTDYDPGSLSLLVDNIALNALETKCQSLSITWGDPLPAALSCLTRDANPTLLLGSDLIYCYSVVKPLFDTVDACLGSTGGLFILVSSFDIGSEAETAIIQCCEVRNIQIEEVFPLDVRNKSCRIQYFKKL